MKIGRVLAALLVALLIFIMCSCTVNHEVNGLISQPFVELTEMANAMVLLLGALITTFIVPWLKAKRTTEQNTNLQFWVTAAVGAAEQYFGSSRGQEKKEYVLAVLREKGFIIDDALIESTVNELFGKIKSTEFVDEEENL